MLKYMNFTIIMYKNSKKQARTYVHIVIKLHEGNYVASQPRNIINETITLWYDVNTKTTRHKSYKLELPSNL